MIKYILENIQLSFKVDRRSNNLTKELNKINETSRSDVNYIDVKKVQI